jgi:hypothetical protein
MTCAIQPFQTFQTLQTFQSSVVSPQERVYNVQFDLLHEAAITHVCDWLLKELECDCDDLVCEITGQHQLRVKLQVCTREHGCDEHSARAFEVVEGIINSAFEHDSAHKNAAGEIFARDLF